MGNSMNEKIKELLPNPFAVDYTTYDEPMDLYREQELEAFAEMIIRECIGICDEVQENYGKYTFTATTVKIKIKEHFGVE